MIRRIAPWLAAAGVALPFALALGLHSDAAAWWLELPLWLLVALIFVAAAFAARHLAGIARGAWLSAGFATVFLVLALLDLVRAGRYTLADPATDLALLFIVFYAALALTRLSVLAGRIALLLPLLALLVPAVVRAGHASSFGSEIGAEGYRAILQTNPGEVLEFFARFIGGGTLLMAIAAVALAVAAAWLALPVVIPGEGLAWSGCFALAAAGVAYGNAALVGERFQGYRETVAYMADMSEYRALREARRRSGAPPRVTQQGPLAGQPQTYVFVIGESLSRNHMSLYGYWRETTPQLARLAPELAVFTDVISPHSHTDASLERVLTLANDANRFTFADPRNYSLVELLRAAGFTTWWISNQNTFGPWDNQTAVLAHDAEHVRYLNQGSGTFITGAHDEVLIEPLAAALADPAPRKAIFLHFLGSHWEYSKRYPAEHAAFVAPPTAREIGAWRGVHANPKNIDHYDNAVRYHDQLVAQVIERLRGLQQPAALVMFADHGESVYAGRFHDYREFTRDHLEVPLILWLSPRYRSAAGETLERARGAARLPFALEDLPHLVGELAHLDSPLLERRRSPLSADYAAPKARRAFHSQLVYEEADEPLLNAQRALKALAEFKPRLWAHRVNTLGKMMEAVRLFDGVEIDVIFDAASGQLLVNHPPQPPSGLTLEQQLAYAGRLAPKLALWLDIKNFSEANAAGVVAALERLDARHSIRGRALVETDHTGPAAALLRSAGFTSGYYLPTALVTSSAGCDAAAELESMLGARRFAAVTYDFRGHRWVERCLGNAIGRLGLTTYTWDVERSLSERTGPGPDEERKRIYPRTAGILLSFRSLFDDWRSIISIPAPAR